MKPIRFFAEGEPVGAPRPRAFLRKDRWGNPIPVQVTDAGKKVFRAEVAPAGGDIGKRLEAWKQIVGLRSRASRPVEPIDEAVFLELLFLMPRLSSHYGTGRNASVLKPSAPVWFEGKPDWDNLGKPVSDVLEDEKFFINDSRVVGAIVLKRYVNPHKGEYSGAWITLRPAVLE